MEDEFKNIKGHKYTWRDGPSELRDSNYKVFKSRHVLFIIDICER